MENLGDPLQASDLGNFHCDNCSGLLLRPGAWSSQEAAGTGKEGVSQLNPEGLEAPIYMRVEE